MHCKLIECSIYLEPEYTSEITYLAVLFKDTGQSNSTLQKNPMVIFKTLKKVSSTL